MQAPSRDRRPREAASKPNPKAPRTTRAGRQDPGPSPANDTGPQTGEPGGNKEPPLHKFFFIMLTFIIFMVNLHDAIHIVLGEFDGAKSAQDVWTTFVKMHMISVLGIGVVILMIVYEVIRHGPVFFIAPAKWSWNVLKRVIGAIRKILGAGTPRAATELTYAMARVAVGKVVRGKQRALAQAYASVQKLMPRHGPEAIVIDVRISANSVVSVHLLALSVIPIDLENMVRGALEPYTGPLVFATYISIL